METSQDIIDSFAEGRVVRTYADDGFGVSDTYYAWSDDGLSVWHDEEDNIVMSKETALEVLASLGDYADRLDLMGEFDRSHDSA